MNFKNHHTTGGNIWMIGMNPALKDTILFSPSNISVIAQ